MKPGQKAAQARIDAAYARLQKGEPFEVVARDVSDDATSKANGGILPMFEPGRWVPAFEDAAFALSNPGDYSKPVRTNYGWHIIKLIEHKAAGFLPDPGSFTTPARNDRQPGRAAAAGNPSAASERIHRTGQMGLFSTMP